jgi:hypothetical protein
MEGSSYVFHRSAGVWTQQTKLMASDPSVGRSFGTSVAISGDVAVAGAPYDSQIASANGAIYVFGRNGTTWTQRAKLLSSTPRANQQHGISVAFDGQRIVGGASSENTPVLIFEKQGGTWTETSRVSWPGITNSIGFGSKVALSSNTLAVGAPLYTGTAGLWQGALFVFRWDGTSWQTNEMICALDPQAQDFFGNSVGAAGDFIATGAKGRDFPGMTNTADAGMTFLYGPLCSTLTSTSVVHATDHLDMGASLIITARVSIAASMSGWVTNTGRVSVAIMDPVASNNSATSVVKVNPITDMDGDGMPNSWEYAHDLDPFVDDAALDDDCDGMSNIQEYWAGTHPRDARSFLRLWCISADAGQVILQFPSAEQRSYDLLSTTNVSGGTWSVVATNLPGAAETTTVIRARGPEVPTEFYRIRAHVPVP